MPEERPLKLRRYWIEFDLSPKAAWSHGLWQSGCGVTAWTLDDALHLVGKTLFPRETVPEVTRVVEDIDISTLEANHLRPNMGVSVWRGVWWPPGRT